MSGYYSRVTRIDIIENAMVYRDDEEEDKKKDGPISDEVLGEALDEDEDDDLTSHTPLEEDEKAWE